MALMSAAPWVDRFERLALIADRRLDPEGVHRVGQQQDFNASGAETFELRAGGDALGAFADDIIDRRLVGPQRGDIIGERALLPSLSAVVAKRAIFSSTSRRSGSS